MTAHLSGGYDFHGPRRIVFGWGRRREVGELARGLGKRAFVVHGSRSLERQGALGDLTAWLQAAGVEVEDLGCVRREPEVDDVDAFSGRLRQRGGRRGDLVIGFGGGAALDLAKAVCAMATQREAASVKDYLEGVGRGLVLEELPLPLLAIPTTAGTGSEATKNAVISGSEASPGGRPFKKSLRSEDMVPRVALVDPELCVSVPAAITAHTGMDAITQLIESYISRRAQPLPQALALEGLRLAGAAIRRAVQDGSDRSAREAMSHAALLSGLALANSGLGFAHGVAPALGIHCGVGHGLACAVMLPAALRVNRDTCRADLARLAEVFCGQRFDSEDLAADACVAAVEALCRDVGIPPRLRDVGVRREQIPALVSASRGNSMSANPRDVSDAELARILEAMF